MKHDFYIQIDDKNPIEVSNTKAFRIGRTVNNSEKKIIIDDPAVSATHCLVIIRDAKIPYFWVWDGNGKVGSKNKTIINGIRMLDGSSPVESERGCRVYHGDFILIANHKVNFLISRTIIDDKDATL